MKWMKRLLAAPLLITVSACGGGAATDSCLYFQPIRPALQDVAAISDRLVAQIEAHNEAGAKICGWRP